MGLADSALGNGLLEESAGYTNEYSSCVILDKE